MESTLWGAVAVFLSQSVFLDVSRNQALTYPHSATMKGLSAQYPWVREQDRRGSVSKKYDVQATTKTND